MNKKIQKRIFEIIQKGKTDDLTSRIFDIVIMSLIVLNVASIYIETLNISRSFQKVLEYFENISVIIFSLEYVLRILTAPLLFPELTPKKARLKYIRSFMAIVDLMAIIPWYLPFVMVLDLRVLRSLRLMRLFRLFKFNRYTSALEKILSVLRLKSVELLSSVFVVFILMMISSILMYTVENPVQPQIFTNGFSGFWWAVATFTTVGYGDIYPVTALGRVLGAIISLLGIGFVAVPTGIISSGFIEQVDRNEKNSTKNEEEHMEKEIHSGYRTDNQDSMVKKYSFCPYCGEKL